MAVFDRRTLKESSVSKKPCNANKNQTKPVKSALDNIKLRAVKGTHAIILILKKVLFFDRSA